MGQKNITRILAVSSSIALIGCSGLNYNKLSLNYPPSQSKEVFYKSKYNLERRPKLKALDLQVLEKSGASYIDSLKNEIAKYLDFTEIENVNFENAKYKLDQAARSLEDAKIADQTLSKFSSGYAPRFGECKDVYDKSLQQLKLQSEARLSELVKKNDLLAAIATSDKLEKLEFVKTETTKNIVNKYTKALVVQSQDQNEAFKQVIQITKEQNQRFDDETKNLVLTFIRGFISQIPENTSELAFRKIDLIGSVLNDSQLLKDDSALVKQRDQLINKYARKMYVLKPINSASTSIEGVDQKLLSKLQSEVTVSDKSHCEVIGGDKLNLIYDKSKVPASLNDLIPTDKNLAKGMSNSYVLAVEVSKIIINKQPPQTREERVESSAPGAGFRDGLAMGVSYSGDVQYFEYTVTTQEAYASIFASMMVYDLMENKIVFKDSVEFEKTFKSTSKSNIMACGQDKVRIGSSYSYTGVGPIKKIPAGYVPNHVLNQYRTSGEGTLPSNDEVKNVLFDSVASQVSEKVKRSLRGE